MDYKEYEKRKRWAKSFEKTRRKGMKKWRDNVSRRGTQAPQSKTERAKMIFKLDRLWSKIIKRDGKCAYCGNTENLTPHHIFTRSNFSVRWDLDNGVCLYFKCHR